MIVELMMGDWFWWLLPLFGVSFGGGGQESKQSAENEARSKSLGSSFSTGASGSTSLATSGFGQRLRPQLEDMTYNFAKDFLGSPAKTSLFSTAIPQLGASGLYASQEALLPELVRLATAPISAGMASRGMVTPENTREVGGAVARTLGPQLMSLIGENVNNIGAPAASLTSPFANLLQAFQSLLSGGQSTQDSFGLQLARSLQEAESQSRGSSTGMSSGDSFSGGIMANYGAAMGGSG